MNMPAETSKSLAKVCCCLNWKFLSNNRILVKDFWFMRDQINFFHATRNDSPEINSCEKK